MPQDQMTGAAASEFGYRMAEIVATRIGAKAIGSEGNEYEWNGKRIVIKSAHRDNDYIGVLYSVLPRVDSILAVLETSTCGEFQVWEMTSDRYLEESKRQSKNPDIAQIRKKEFVNAKYLVAKVKDTV